MRSDIDWFQEQQFLYLALDEGHVIKGQGKTATAIRALTARHRLILSGTPIQNNVKELWNLFDFLMPGFLGTAGDFSRRYHKPIEGMQGAAADSQEFIDGERALKALHRCVLPFMLRRLKRDVLKDLPDKIIQDRLCGMSPLQRFLYSKHEKALSCITSDESAPKDVQHVFQSLMHVPHALPLCFFVTICACTHAVSARTRAWCKTKSRVTGDQPCPTSGGRRWMS